MAIVTLTQKIIASMNKIILFFCNKIYILDWKRFLLLRKPNATNAKSLYKNTGKVN